MKHAPTASRAWIGTLCVCCQIDRQREAAMKNSKELCSVGDE